MSTPNAPIMFHQFVTERSANRPGAFTPSDLADLIDRERPINADEWCAAVLAGTTPDRTMLTFDDGLLCQYRHALPVLEHFKLQALFFIPTGPVFGEGGEWETHRWIREEMFESWEAFWHQFNGRFDIDRMDPPPGDYLRNHAFYTPEERMYRWVRQQFPEVHADVMKTFLLERSELRLPRFFMNASEVYVLFPRHGQIVGSHGNAHIDPRDYDPPTRTRTFAADWALSFYRLYALTHGTCRPIVSYPYGAFFTGLEHLDEVIRLAFMSCPGPTDNLMRYPRRDAGVLLREMRSE